MSKKDQSADIYGRSYGTLKYAGMISRLKLYRLWGG